MQSGSATPATATPTTSTSRTRASSWASLAQSLNGSVSIGDALSQAKQLYAAQTGVLDPFDLKADMESTYYGMPNYTLSGLAHPSTNSAAATPQLALGQ